MKNNSKIYKIKYIFYMHSYSGLTQDVNMLKKSFLINWLWPTLSYTSIAIRNLG